MSMFSLVSSLDCLHSVRAWMLPCPFRVCFVPSVDPLSSQTCPEVLLPSLLGDSQPFKSGSED